MDVAIAVIVVEVKHDSTFSALVGHFWSLGAFSQSDFADVGIGLAAAFLLSTSVGMFFVVKTQTSACPTEA